MSDQPKPEKPAPSSPPVSPNDTAPVGKDVTYDDWAMI